MWPGGRLTPGLVYQTDAMTRPQEVQVIAAAPPESHKPVVYPLALIKGAANEAVAKEFVALVLSPQGQAVLQKYGFTTRSPRKNHKISGLIGHPKIMDDEIANF